MSVWKGKKYGFEKEYDGYFSLSLFFSGCTVPGSKTSGSIHNGSAGIIAEQPLNTPIEAKIERELDNLKENLRGKYRDKKPRLWGEMYREL